MQSKQQREKHIVFSNDAGASWEKNMQNIKDHILKI